MSVTLIGIPASMGIAIANAYTLCNPVLNVVKKEVTDTEIELSRFLKAVDQAKSELEEIQEKALHSMGQDKASIFAAHVLVLNDPELIDPIKASIIDEKVNAEFALSETSRVFINLFEQMDNEYMKERAADIRDVTNRILARLMGVVVPNLSTISEEVILIADDLTPSDTVQLNPRFVLGFATNVGGRTSHSAIMARSLEIPAVVGTRTVLQSVGNGTLVIIDGLEGKVIVDPTAEVVAHYRRKQEVYLAQREEWARLVDRETRTQDGSRVELVANIGTPSDIAGVINNGGEGVGLFRTEFLYMGRNQLPTEEEQFQAYKAVLESMKDKPVVVRTLDIGGDKELPYLNLPKEMNPFLGFRAIRICLDQQEIFRSQLRALLRASVSGNLKIMFPMIATLNEYLQAKRIYLEEKERLILQGVQVSSDIEIGIMVEIPSTAIMADVFAPFVDFFSIGTNDLVQYTLSADRMNERVSYLYQPFNPAILRLIDHVIKAAHQHGKWVGMCGEMAGDPLAIPLLLAFGLDEFSMSASSILPARSQLSRLSREETAKNRELILSFHTTEEVLAFLRNTFGL